MSLDRLDTRYLLLDRSCIRIGRVGHTIKLRVDPTGTHYCIALYVDDLIIAGENKVDIATIKGQISERFNMKDLGLARKFLGMEIEYGSNCSIKIHQQQYIQQLLTYHGMQDCSPVITSMDTSVKLISAKDDEALADSKSTSE